MSSCLRGATSSRLLDHADLTQGPQVWEVDGSLAGGQLASSPVPTISSRLKLKADIATWSAKPKSRGCDNMSQQLAPTVQHAPHPTASDSNA